MLFQSQLPVQTEIICPDGANADPLALILECHIHASFFLLILKMEVQPVLSYYNDVPDGTALITKTLETTNHLTPLHIPPGPPILPAR